MLIRKAHPFIGSMAGALAMLAPGILCSVIVLNEGPLVLASGQIDDSSLRGAGVFLYILPWLYAVSVLLFFGVGHLLLRFGVRKLSHFIALATAPSLLIAAYISLWMSQQYPSGWSGVLFAFLATSAGSFVCVTLGATCWWWFATRPRDERVAQDI